MKKEKIEKIAIISLLAIVSMALIYTLINFFSDSKVDKSVNSINNFETKTSESAVSIDLTPKEFRDGKFYIDIYFNTHTVSLDQFDLKKLITLEFEGRSINPGSVPTLSGHHSGGALVFDTGKEIKKFSMTIRGMPDIEERVFEWP